MVAETERPVDDEIDLFDLIDDVKDKWQWAVGSAAVVTLLALVYAFWATPTYRSELVFKPASEAELLPLNQPKLREVFGVAEDQVYLTPEKAFKDVRKLALSSNYMRGFYSELLASATPELNTLIYDAEITPEQNVSKFAEWMSHSDPAAKSTDVFLGLQFDLSDSTLSAQVLNQYGLYIQRRYMSEMQAAVSMRIKAQLEQWRVEAEEIRTRYLADKNRRLVKLQEAAAVAASINQKLPMYSGDRVAVGFEPPLYMMGERALRAEIAQLQSRSEKGEDMYIEGLPELLWKIRTVEEANVEWAKVSFVQLDQDAIVPLSPIKPKKKLVVALGAVAGVMIGLLLALITAAHERRQQRKSQRAIG